MQNFLLSYKKTYFAKSTEESLSGNQVASRTAGNTFFLPLSSLLSQFVETTGREVRENMLPDHSAKSLKSRIARFSNFS